MIKYLVKIGMIGAVSLICANAVAQVPGETVPQPGPDQQGSVVLETSDADLAAKIISGKPFRGMNGFMHICAGKTTEGSTGWIPYNGGTTGIYVDVSTAECGFDAVPIYSVNMHGNAGNWATTGGSSAYHRTATGFRIYVRYWNGAAITPAQANEKGWHIQWIAIGS